MNSQKLLSDLNPQQNAAVSAGLGQVLVLAGPGSGKTRVLTSRIAYLIGTQGVRPFNILAVTFTNKAAREMESRITQLLGENTQGIWLGTFHSICARILRREADQLPFTSSFVIFDEDDQQNLIKRALRELNIDDKIFRPVTVRANISSAKNSLILPTDYPSRNYRDEIIGRIYTRYQELLQANNAVDFDDLLLWTAHLLDENQTVRERYAQRFVHVLVDEFQDTNVVQYQLLRHLASYHHNLFAVGDEDQSIYRWRGADYRNVLRFEQDFPKCQKILLEQNYRSTQTVLDAARAVIDQNTQRTPKNLFSERGRGDRITLYEASDDHAEAAFVADTINQLLQGGKAKGSDFAVMYRTNAQSRLLEEAFLHSGTPYRLVGAQRFYGRREVKDIIAYLRVVQNPRDEVSLGRVINVPPRGLGDKTLVTLQTCARQSNSSMGEVLLSLAARADASPHWAAFTGRGAQLLADFGKLLAGWRDAAIQIALPELFDRIVTDSAYYPFIDDGSEEGADRWANVQELRRLAFEFQDRGLDAFLENLALVSDQDTLPDGLEVPTLLTLHAAKGLEFSQVFITGLDDGLLPHSRSLEDPEEMAEERRLFYVGLTRARNRVYLVRAEQRTTFGSFEYSIPSRFLKDIPEELLFHQGERKSTRTKWDRSESTTWSLPKPKLQTGLPQKQAPKPKTAPLEPKYKSNMRVRHATYGEGLVVDTRVQDGDETVDVFFDSFGFKRLVASLAHLEILA